MPRQCCQTCPWRKTTKKGRFSGGIVDAVGLAEAIQGSGGVQKCHSSPAAGPLVCVGFAHRVGNQSAMFRVGVDLGQIENSFTVDDSELLTIKDLVKKHGGVVNGQSRQEAMTAIESLLK